MQTLHYYQSTFIYLHLVIAYAHTSKQGWAVACGTAQHGTLQIIKNLKKIIKPANKLFFAVLLYKIV
jgi:hypothetical protein